MMFRLPCGILKAVKKRTALSALGLPWVLACAGTVNVLPVYLPGDPVECLFEVIGDMTVPGPFRAEDDVPGGAREAMLQGVRLEVGRSVADSGADAALVREFIYDADAVGAEASTPEIVAVEGMLVSFVDPACVPGA